MSTHAPQDRSASHLAAYLNDHLAGATSAVELLRHLSAAYAGDPLAAFADALCAEVAADRDELRRVMATLDLSESRVRQASGWAAQKLAEWKVRLDDPAKRGLHRFELLEALSLGIEGKRQLWLALDAASRADPALRVADYPSLIARAEDQRSRVEPLRFEAARIALVGGTAQASGVTG